MVWRTTHGPCRRLVGSALLATLLAILPVPAAGLSGSSLPHAVMLRPGAGSASAQGGMDVGILTPSFSELPGSVLPGDTFTIGVSTAPGARCTGQVTFRDHPPIDLEEAAAPGGTCAWTINTSVFRTIHSRRKARWKWGITTSST